jgi:hypothetical protein
MGQQIIQKSARWDSISLDGTTLQSSQSVMWIFLVRRFCGFSKVTALPIDPDTDTSIIIGYKKWKRCP